LNPQNTKLQHITSHDMNMKTEIIQQIHTNMLVKHINNHHYSSVVHIYNAVMRLLVCLSVYVWTSCLMACIQLQLDS